MYTIGEFSRITGLSVKTLRFYHEKDLLVPSCVDSGSGYRYYHPHQIEKARIIACFRAWEFSLADIKDILDHYDDQADILDHLERHKQRVESKIRQYRNITLSLDRIITHEREAIKMIQNASFNVEEKTLPALLIAGVRMKGRYADCGKGFALLGKKVGRHLAGKPLNLYYDGEYREEDANFEPCFPLRKAVSVEGISVRELPGGRCVSLLHQGPYQELGRSYAILLDYIRQKGLETTLPTREVYIKGPGMIFKGNPKKYLTEIQILVKS